MKKVIIIDDLGYPADDPSHVVVFMEWVQMPHGFDSSMWYVVKIEIREQVGIAEIQKAIHEESGWADAQIQVRQTRFPRLLKFWYDVWYPKIPESKIGM